MPELYDHQNTALGKMHDGCILTGGVGTGKTMTALGYYMMAHHKRDLYVITTAKKRDSLDWNREAASWAIGTSREETVAGVLTVDSWNNIGKYVDITGAFFIFDEQRLVGSGAWVKSFLKIAKRNQWILLSATPADTWLDYIPVFVANGFYKNRTEFKLEHVVYSTHTKYPKVERYLGVRKLIQNRDRVLVEMPYRRTTTRKLEIVPVGYDKESFDKALRTRWDPFKDAPIENVSQLNSVLRQLTNNHPSRMEAVERLAELYGRLIIFYNFNYELEVLRKLGEKYTLAEWNGHKHQDLPTGDKWVYLVQYVSGAEGWNCVTTNHMVFYSQTYSYRQFEQAQGRIDRLNTPYTELYYHILKSQSPLDLAVSKALRNKRDFQPKHLLTFDL